MKMNAKNIELLTNIYMYVYAEFAASTKEIENKFSITKAKALKFCTYLSDIGLIDGELSEFDNEGYSTGRMGFKHGQKVGTMYMWQCWNTYDSEDEREAKKRVMNAFNQIMLDNTEKKYG